MLPDDRTTVIQGWIDRLLAGDETAREALLECACGRLSRLARRMLKGYPGVARWEQTDDVLQGALLRLDRALSTITPSTARDFFCLAAAQIRRELIDLARRHSGPEGWGAHHASQAGRIESDARADVLEPSDFTDDPARLMDWTEFHRQVDALEDDEREVFDLLWYHGMTQAQAAKILGVTERTVKRRWLAARLALSDALDGEPPS
jgi:RNA polymerase sigma-70 factor (ECF subfamily)